jgi:hypothetical protein
MVLEFERCRFRRFSWKIRRFFNPAHRASVDLISSRSRSRWRVRVGDYLLLRCVGYVSLLRWLAPCSLKAYCPWPPRPTVSCVRRSLCVTPSLTQALLLYAYRELHKTWLVHSKWQWPLGFLKIMTEQTSIISIFKSLNKIKNYDWVNFRNDWVITVKMAESI